LRFDLSRFEKANSTRVPAHRPGPADPISRASPGLKCATSPGSKSGIWTRSTRVRQAMRQPGPYCEYPGSE